VPGPERRRTRPVRETDKPASAAMYWTLVHLNWSYIALDVIAGKAVDLSMLWSLWRSCSSSMDTHSTSNATTISSREWSRNGGGG
jgi:hypothetical protein